MKEAPRRWKRNSWLWLINNLARAVTQTRALTWGGRHSLLVYLLHQPVFLALIYVATLFTSPEEANYRRVCETQCTRAGGEAPFCARACGCVVVRLKRDNLWSPVMRNAMTPIETAAFTALSQQCAREANAP